MTAQEDFTHLLPDCWKETVVAWLREDCPGFDYGGYVVGNCARTATLWLKSASVVAGRPFFDQVFDYLGCKVHWQVIEGSYVDLDPGSVVMIATVTGPARKILLGERVALNTLARCSGIATQSRGIINLVRQKGYGGIIAGTRKTTPGFRLVEKYGMVVGGVDTHRFDLSSMVMLKDNHIWSKGTIAGAIEAARRVAGFSLRIDVEVKTEDEANEAIQAGADIIMLDNFSGPKLKIASKNLKSQWAGRRRFLLECSGGLTESNISEYLCNEIDIFSTSSLHSGIMHTDYSLKFESQ